MKIVPDDKKRAAIYGGVIVVALIVAIYLLFLRGGGSPEPEPEVLERADTINSSVQTPPPAPELPVEGRPQRGPPTAPTAPR
jgi:hypothetical protein